MSSKQTFNVIFRIPKWLEGNLPSFEYFRKITLTCLQKARRCRDLTLWSLLTMNNNTPWITTSTIQTNGNRHHFFIRITLLGHILVHSFDKTVCFLFGADLADVLEYIFSTLFQRQTNLLRSQDSKEAM